MSLQVSDAYRQFKGNSYFGSLNGLRCLSVMAVLWHHSPIFESLDNAPLLLMRGFLGVDMFFVLSGFLITTLLIREEIRKGRFSIAGFYFRRALRILPVYFLLVTALSIYYIFLKQETQYAPLVPYYYLFVSNFLTVDIPLLDPTWSLSVEEQYYLVWPLVLLLTMPFRAVRGWVLFAVILFCVTAQIWGMWPGPIYTEHATWALPGGPYSAILLGSLLAVILDKPKGFALVWLVLHNRWSPIIMLGALLVSLQFLPGILTGWPDLIVHLLMVLFLASIVIREDHKMADVLCFVPVARIGVISYGVYLYHMIGLDIATRTISFLGFVNNTTLWVSLVYVLVSIIIAEISFRKYERYFLSLKIKAK